MDVVNPVEQAFAANYFVLDLLCSDGMFWMLALLFEVVNGPAQVVHVLAEALGVHGQADIGVFDGGGGLPHFVEEDLRTFSLYQMVEQKAQDYYEGRKYP